MNVNVCIFQTFQQNVRGQMNLGVRGGMASAPRYPAPIQRPVPYQQGGGTPGNNMMGGSGRHRPQHNSPHPATSRPPPNMNKMQTSQGGGQPYYGAHGKLEEEDLSSSVISVSKGYYQENKNLNYLCYLDIPLSCHRS